MRKLGQISPKTLPLYRRQWSSKAFVLLFEPWLQRMFAGWVVWHRISQNVVTNASQFAQVGLGLEITRPRGKNPKFHGLQWHDDAILLELAWESLSGEIFYPHRIRNSHGVEYLVSIEKLRSKIWRSWPIMVWCSNVLVLGMCVVFLDMEPVQLALKWIHGRICGRTVGQWSSPMVCWALEDFLRHFARLQTREHWTKGPLFFCFCVF